MRVFRREDVRAEQMLEGDLLHDRWLARDAQGQQVVLLGLRAEHAARADLRNAWVEQAARNAACRHAGLLPVVDHGVHSGTAFLAREHAADALPLSSLLAHLEGQGESLPVLLGVHVARALCDTLCAALDLTVDGQARPLFHGDLVAERVLVRADGRLQLCELGLNAGLLSAPSEEQAGRADLHALGLLLKRMLVPGSGQKSDATRALVPVLPPPAVVQLIGKLTASAPMDRTVGMHAVRQDLAALASHGAGAAVLAQLVEDARTLRASVPAARSSIPSAPVARSAPPSTGVSTTKTALFVTPLVAGAGARMDGRASPAREATGGFRGRTQVFGTPTSSAPIAAVAPAEAPRVEPPQAAALPAIAATPVVSPLRGPPLTATDQPALLTPRSTPPATGFGDDMPPLLAGGGRDVRVASPRLDLTGMPPLLSQAPSLQAPRTETVDPPALAQPVRASASVAPAREVAPISTPRTVEQPAPRMSLEAAPVLPLVPSAPAPANDNGLEDGKHESGLRLSSPVRTAVTEAPELALPDPARRADGSSVAPRKREKWREASETVFKAKVPAIMANLAPRERISPALMFVIAMVVATVLIIGIRLLVGLIV